MSYRHPDSCFESTFDGCRSSGERRTLNQPIGGRDVSSVATMYAMFEDTAFNQPIGDWGVSSVISICVMFGAGAAGHPGFSFSLRGREWVGSTAERGTRRYCGRDGSSPGTTCLHRVP